MLRNTLFGISCLALAATASADEPDDTTRAEINQLIAYLQQSDCRFYRNGKWHDSAAAVKHLNKKYRYLLKKGYISTTETFISRAASKSSISKKDYRVQCGESDPVTSESWFSDQLAEIRNNP